MKQDTSAARRSPVRPVGAYFPDSDRRSMHYIYLIILYIFSRVGLSIDFYAEQKMVMYTPHSEYNYLFGIDSMPNRRGGVVRFKSPCIHLFRIDWGLT